MKRLLVPATLLALLLAPTFAEAGWGHHCWGHHYRHHCCWGMPSGQIVLVQGQPQLNQQGLDLTLSEVNRFINVFTAVLDGVNLGNAGKPAIGNNVNLKDYVTQADLDAARGLLTSTKDFGELVSRVDTLETDLKALPKKADLDALETKLLKAIAEIKK